jgi:acyl-coenzyme A synthetase/AMP-(fatty) acid ligase
MPQALSDTLRDSSVKFSSGPALLFNPGFRYLVTSYQELREASGRVASLLQSRGVKMGDRVIIWGPTVHNGYSHFSAVSGRVPSSSPLI